MYLRLMGLVAGGLLLCGSLAAAEAPAGAWYRAQQAIMGTQVEVALWHQEPAAAQAALDAVMAEMHRIDALMSPYRPDSELSLMNRQAAQRPVPVSAEMFALLQRAQYFSALSNGAFDVTFGSLGRHFDYRAGVRPDAAQIAAALPAINHAHLQLDAAAGTVRYLHPLVYVDLGGIAKGHAVDRSIALLQARGISQAMVAAGGDSRVLGDRHGRPWTVGVRDPRRDGEMVVLLPLVDTAISTSGDYERYFDEGEQRYHHILDPGTGDSARAVRSVTVLGPNATDTDALSTTLFVLGVAEGLALLAQLPAFDAILVDAQGRLHFSPGLQALR